MDFRIIKSPTEGTLDILKRRKSSGISREFGNTDAIGACKEIDRHGVCGRYR